MNKTLTTKDDELIQRVYQGDKNFTESELRDLATEFPIYDLIEGDNRRWLKSMDTVLKIDDKYFMVCWQEGLIKSNIMGYIVETKEIKKTSANKWCENCNKHIKIGKSSIAVQCYDGEFYEVNVCSVGCMEEFEKSLNIKVEEDDVLEEEL